MNRRDTLKFLAGATAFAGTAGVLGRGAALAPGQAASRCRRSATPTTRSSRTSTRATMQIHHDNHHAAYVNNLNNYVDKWPDLATKPIDEILSNLSAVPEGGAHASCATTSAATGTTPSSGS